MHPIRLRSGLTHIMVLVLLTLSTFSGAAAEAPRGPLGGTYTQLTPGDLRLVRKATARLLVTGRTGSTTSWKNDESGNFGTMELEGSFRSGGIPCKQIDHVLQFRNESDPRLLRLTFCRIRGQWKLAR